MINLFKSFLDHTATLGVVYGMCKLGASNASAYNICVCVGGGGGGAPQKME
jgi:hypothetical protein